ncbi:MAG: hypothetical protein H7125_09085 [Proteobacteria bacterium]|nr:hypothetical protein [Burkholderiales bacterium]
MRFTLVTSTTRGRLEWANWTTSAAHLALLGFATQSDERRIWAVCLLLIGTISLFAWAGNYRRWRAIVDTPTSRVESAAQGYVELSGRARWPGAEPLRSRLRDIPCCWYWFQIEEQGSKDEWTVQSQGESPAPFLLDDGSGQCVIHPGEAEIHSRHREVWLHDDLRYTELTILPDDPLYAIGAFSSERPFDAKGGVDAAIGVLLAKWKDDRARLLERFDLDRNGELDVQEWTLARRQARREVETRRAQAAHEPALHVMRRPRDNRLFLLSNMEPESLARKYVLWKWAHLGLLFAGLIAGSALLIN